MTIEQLLERVVNLETRVKCLESELSTTKRTGDNLKIMLVSQQQYSRLPCAAESEIDKNIIANNIDKVHPIGATLDNKQQRIVKFKTDSFKEKICMAQKQRKERDERRRPVNFEPSLTRRRIELLSNAKHKTKNNDLVKFAYRDMHGTLKIVLQNPLKRKFVYSFNTEIEFDKI